MKVFAVFICLLVLCLSGCQPTPVLTGEDLLNQNPVRSDESSQDGAAPEAEGDYSDSAISDAQANLYQSWLHNDELAYRGINISYSTVEDMLALLGEASDLADDDYYDVLYVYEDASFAALDGYIGAIDIYQRTEYASPRDIKIGDTLEDILRKFPQERNYWEDEEGYFYGYDVWTEPSGYVSEFEGGRLLIATVSGDSYFLRIQFDENDKAVYIGILSPI